MLLSVLLTLAPLLRDESIKEENATTVEPAASSSEPSEALTMPPFRNGKYDWSAMLPSLENLRNRKHERVEPSKDPRKPRIYSVRSREVSKLMFLTFPFSD